MRYTDSPVVVLPGMVVCLLLLSCGGCPSAPSGPGESGADQQSVMTVGEARQLASGTLDSAGGEIRFDSPGDPLHGLTLKVPQGAYAEPLEFSISYRPILEYVLPEGLEPILPLIHVDNGGHEAEDIMTLTIPVSIPADSFVMVFRYDETRQKLEAMTVLSETATSLTVAARHFSPAVPLKIRVADLVGKTFPTRFAPGTDDWPFENLGSYITPRGNCGGLSLSAMWYYDNRRQSGEPPLKGESGPRYDNADLAPDRGTPRLGLDDDDAIRLCSVVQSQLHLPAEKQYRDMLEEEAFAGTEDQLQFYEVAAALKVTGQPQMLVVWKTGRPVSHAIICYKVVNNTLYVADPNFPGQEKTIQLASGKFTPFVSADNSIAAELGEVIGYDRVQFIGRGCLYHFERIGSYFTDLEAGDVGRDEFPGYWIRVSELDDESNVVRTFGLDMFNDNHVSHEALMFEVVGESTLEANVTIYDFDDLASPLPLPLALIKPGDNLLGFYVTGKAGWTEEGATSGETVPKTGYRWLGFDWVNIVYTAAGETCDTAEVRVVNGTDVPIYVTVIRSDGASFASMIHEPYGETSLFPPPGHWTLTAEGLPWYPTDWQQEIDLTCSGYTWTLGPVSE